MMKKSARSIMARLLIVVVFLLAPLGSKAGDYLSSGDIAAVAAGSAGIFGLGEWLSNIDSTKKPLLSGPLPFERSLQTYLGGQYRLGQRNFLDTRIGAIYTPAAAGLVLAAANVGWPREKTGKDFAQDLLLYLSGLMVTDGVTGIAKGLVGRPRPLANLEPEVARRRPTNDFTHNHQSFFSGHTSGSFYAVTYLNKRLRSVMRRNSGDYRNWQWLPPTLLYGWATFVGWSRIQAYQHYPSDVLAGALAGFLVAELFYSLGTENTLGDPESGVGQRLITVTLSF